MSTELYDNDFETALASPMLVGDLTATVLAAAPTALQGGQYRILVARVDPVTRAVSNKERMLVTAGETTTTWTVTRGIEGTTAVGHAAGEVVAHVLTAASLKAVLSPASTVTGPDSVYGDPAVGTSLDYARADHDHGFPVATNLFVRSAVGVPFGAPTPFEELAFAFDTTPGTGGLYFWDGSDWIKASNIP